MCIAVCLGRDIKEDAGVPPEETSPPPEESEEKVKAEKEASWRAYGAARRAKIQSCAL